VSRFANRASTARLDLGPCQCDGAPHDADWVEYRTQLGYGDFGQIATVAQTDLLAAKRKTLEVAIVAWNLVGPSGEEMPIDGDSVYELDMATAETIYNAVDAAVFADQNLPNGSGARSRNSSRASASRTRK